MMRRRMKRGWRRVATCGSASRIPAPVWATARARAPEPFFTTKPAGVGTGLGLAMAKDFAVQSGGGMTIESSPGRGTTVTLWLPVAATGAVPAQAAASGPGDVAAVPGSAPPHPRVLLVDDDAPLREILAMVLEDAGYRVVQAANGQAALALLATGPAVDALVT